LYTTLQKSTTQLKTPKKSTPVREWAYNNLKSDVLAGRFTPGERLTEEHLASSLGVSRTPVREALHKLASEGLIQPLESRGFCVARDSREDIEDLFDIRAALEGYAIRIVCDYITEPDIRELNGFIEKAEDAFSTGLSRKRKMRFAARNSMRFLNITPSFMTPCMRLFPTRADFTA
jgi:DNA-binding GntR family transcriptional regulator